MKKIRVYHFHNGTGGGVLSVIKNLLLHANSEQIENHIIYTINKDLVPHYIIKPVTGAVSERLFYYRAANNFYYTCRQLAKLLPDANAVVVSHDWLELGMISNLGLQNPVVQVVHGNYDYYYDLATKHRLSIDAYITVSPAIKQKLDLLLPSSIENIYYKKFPVPELKAIEKKNNDRLRIFYCVRSLMDDNKQFKILPLINRKLIAKGLEVEWTIVGDGISKEEVEDLMGQNEGIILRPSLTNEAVVKLLSEHDIFILPSLQEGFPVAVVEAMKTGAVPLVTDWHSATIELIIPGETGYYIEIGDADGYANKILQLNNDRNLLKRLAENAVKKANELFNPYINTQQIEAIIMNAASLRRPKHPQRIYGSRLDKPWIPNFITTLCR